MNEKFINYFAASLALAKAVGGSCDLYIDARAFAAFTIMSILSIEVNFLCHS